MDILAILNRIEVLLKMQGRTKAEFYAACEVTPSAVSQWRSGRTTPYTKTLQRMADYLDVSYEYLTTGNEPKKAPALTEKDRRDVAKDVYQIMQSLESSGDLMFDGVPMSEESKAAMAAAMKIGLEEARRRNKATYTPKKFRRE